MLNALMILVNQNKCEYHIKLEDNTKQVVHPVRKIALALRGN